MGFLTICSDAAGQIHLALAEDGTLWKAEEVSGQNPASYVATEKRSETDSGADEAEGAGIIEHWTPVDFNGMYAGYYPSCHFTALVATKVDFAAAGTGADGLPYVFRSLRGGVWDQVALIGKTPMDGMVQARGRVNAMLFEPVTAQIFLLCDNGELVTLPDCPKCVRIRKVADQAIVSGRIFGETLELTLLDGTILKVGISDIVQYRVSYSYARGYLASHGGTIVWLGQGQPDFEQVTGRNTETVQARGGNTNIVQEKCRNTETVQARGGNRETWQVRGGNRETVQAACRNKETVQAGEQGGTAGQERVYQFGGIRTICIPPDDVTDWLRETLTREGKERFLAFWCDYGVQADVAADGARRMGYTMAFSLGGERKFLHVV